MPPAARKLKDLEIKQRRRTGRRLKDRQTMGQGMAERTAQKLILADLVGTKVLDDDTVLPGPGQRTGVRSDEQLVRLPAPASPVSSTARNRRRITTCRVCRLDWVQRLVGQPLDDGALPKHSTLSAYSPRMATLSEIARDQRPRPEQPVAADLR